MKAKVIEIFNLCLEINSKDGVLEVRKKEISNLPTVFVEYSGHVNTIYIRVFKNGWTYSECHDYEKPHEIDIDLSFDNAGANIEKCKQYLLRVLEMKNEMVKEMEANDDSR
jgi:hypothetical protein